MDNSRQASVSVNSKIKDTDKTLLNDSLFGHSVDLDEDILSTTEEPMNNPDNAMHNRKSQDTEINFDEEYAELDAFFQSYDSEIQQLSSSKSESQSDEDLKQNQSLNQNEIAKVKVNSETQSVNTDLDSSKNDTLVESDIDLGSDTNFNPNKEALDKSNENILMDLDTELSKPFPTLDSSKIDTTTTEDKTTVEQKISVVTDKENEKNSIITPSLSATTSPISKDHLATQGKAATSLHKYQNQDNKPKPTSKKQRSSQSKTKYKSRAKKLESKATLFDRILAGLFSLLIFGMIGLTIDFVISVLRSIIAGGSGISWLFAPFLSGLGFFIGFLSTADSDNVSSVKSTDNSVSGEVMRGIIIATSIFAIGWLFIALT